MSHATQHTNTKTCQAEKEKDMVLGESKMLLEQSNATELHLKQLLRKATRRATELKSELEENRDKHEADALKQRNTELEHQVRRDMRTRQAPASTHAHVILTVCFTPPLDSAQGRDSPLPNRGGETHHATPNHDRESQGSAGQHGEPSGKKRRVEGGNECSGAHIQWV